MNMVTKKHQLEVARRTLKTPGAVLALIGGMTYAEAYRVVFKTDLAKRCAALISEYGDKAARPFEDGGVNWELSQYGWTPAEILAQLGEVQ